jgi:hypothetical protein
VPNLRQARHHMTWVERHLDEGTDSVWAIAHTPAPDGIFCVFGDVWYGPHAHMLDLAGNPTDVLCAWEEDE